MNNEDIVTNLLALHQNIHLHHHSVAFSSSFEDALVMAVIGMIAHEGSVSETSTPPLWKSGPVMRCDWMRG
jgi:hypothetical protein